MTGEPLHSSLPRLVPRRSATVASLWRITTLLLRRIALSGGWAWRWTSVALLPWWWSLTVTLLARWSTISMLLLSSILRWLLAVLTLWRSAVALLLSISPWPWRHSTAHGLLLVLGIVGWIDGTHNELDHPQIGREVDRWLSARHLCRLVLVVFRKISY